MEIVELLSSYPNVWGWLNLPLSIATTRWSIGTSSKCQTHCTPNLIPIAPQLSKATIKFFKLWKDFFFPPSSCYKTRITKNITAGGVSRNLKRNGIGSHRPSLQSKLEPALSMSDVPLLPPLHPSSSHSPSSSYKVSLKLYYCFANLGALLRIQHALPFSNTASII